MHIAGIHRASTNTVYFYALCIHGPTHIGIGVAKYMRDSMNKWRWEYNVRFNVGAGRKEVSHDA